MTQVLKTRYIIEAVLFSAGKPLLIEEIAEFTGLSAREIRKLLDKLIEEYKEKEGAVEVSRVGDKYAMQLRTRYAHYTLKVAPLEIPRYILKTLALIAYHQPIQQSDLKNLIGSRVYDHVPILMEHGMIKAVPEGRSKVLSTTDRFPEYFGIDGTSPDRIKRYLAEEVGIISKRKSIEDWEGDGPKPGSVEGTDAKVEGDDASEAQDAGTDDKGEEDPDPTPEDAPSDERSDTDQGTDDPVEDKDGPEETISEDADQDDAVDEEEAEEDEGDEVDEGEDRQEASVDEKEEIDVANTDHVEEADEDGVEEREEDE